MREYHTRLATYGGKSTDTSAKQLITTPCAHDLEIKSLIKLAKLFRSKANTQCYSVIGGNYPAMVDKQRSTGRQSALTAGNTEKERYRLCNTRIV